MGDKRAAGWRGKTEKNKTIKRLYNQLIEKHSDFLHFFFFFLKKVTFTRRRISHVPSGAGNTAVSAWCAWAARLLRGGIPVSCRNIRPLPPAIICTILTRLAVDTSCRSNNSKRLADLVWHVLSYQHVSGNRFNVVQQNFFTVSIITKHNHGGGARRVQGVYPGVVEL